MSAGSLNAVGITLEGQGYGWRYSNGACLGVDPCPTPSGSPMHIDKTVICPTDKLNKLSHRSYTCVFINKCLHIDSYLWEWMMAA